MKKGFTAGISEIARPFGYNTKAPIMSLNAQRSAHISFSCLYDIYLVIIFPYVVGSKQKPKGNEYYKENDKRTYLLQKVSFNR